MKKVLKLRQVTVTEQGASMVFLNETPAAQPGTTGQAPQRTQQGDTVQIRLTDPAEAQGFTPGQEYTVTIE